jgi:hypothetical protein
MTPEHVLDHPALVLDQRARKRYFDDGFLTVPGYRSIFSAQAPAARPALVDQAPARPAP